MKKRQRLAQLKWKILLVTTMSITVLWKCSPYIHPGPSGTVQLLNVKNLGTLNSAYLLGQASFSNDSVQSVQVSYDGGTPTSAVGTSSWKVAVPVGVLLFITQRTRVETSVMW